jgi:hypothetical protein
VCYSNFLRRGQGHDSRGPYSTIFIAIRAAKIALVRQVQLYDAKVEFRGHISLTN